MYNSYYYPYYRRYPIPVWPVAYNPYYANYGSYINAYQSQIGNQSIVNTGTASNINQIFTPTAIY